MADYKGIQGRSVQSLSADPGTLENVTGQVWYNTTTGTFKLSTENAVSTGSWSAAPNLNTGRYYFNGAGSTTAGIVAAGTPGGIKTEIYNGTAWSEDSDLNAVKGYPGIAGISTAAICTGQPTSIKNVETWDGTSWSETADTNTDRSNSGPARGPVTATIVAGGAGGGINADPGATETYNGTSWTETGNNMNSPAAQGKAGLGTQTAMMSVGGEPTVALSETYDGSTWTEGNNLNVGGGNFSGSGITTAGIVFGGTGPRATASETYDGTSWSTAPATAQAHGPGLAGGDVGSSLTASFAAGGYTAGGVVNVDHWTYTQYAAKTVTVT